MDYMNWFDCLPPAETSVPCGAGTHPVRWEAGRLSLPAHPDAEAELVLGALGGDKPACLTLAETWESHLDDLAVLMTGPRGLADPVPVTWDQVGEQRERWAGPDRVVGFAAGPALNPGRPPVASRGPQPRAMRYAGRAPGPADSESARRAEHRFEVLRLMALGPAFQFRLSGTVAAAWAAESRTGDRAGHRPDLTAALTGRFALVAAQWLGIAPDAVMITPHEGSGWGSLTATGTGTGTGTGDSVGDNTGWRLSGSLSASWLSSVWACGLALIDGHLTVAVEQAGYPHARVLALPAPGATPVAVDIGAILPGERTDLDEGSGDGPVPRWQNR
ncbi:MAG TPA: hypothetical protein VGG75_01220 [Trebonia sp.]